MIFYTPTTLHTFFNTVRQKNKRRQHSGANCNGTRRNNACCRIGRGAGGGGRCNGSGTGGGGCRPRHVSSGTVYVRCHTSTTGSCIFISWFFGFSCDGGGAACVCTAFGNFVVCPAAASASGDDATGGDATPRQSQLISHHRLHSCHRLSSRRRQRRRQLGKAAGKKILSTWTTCRRLRPRSQCSASPASVRRLTTAGALRMSASNAKSKEFVHSWVVCDAVWMPKEGKYLCSRT